MFYEELPEGPEREELLCGLTERQRKYQQAAYELLTTEESYERDMRLILDVFVLPLIESRVLPSEIIRGIFTDQFPRLCDIHQLLLEDLKSLRKGPLAQPGIGKLMETYAQLLQTYSGYFVNHAKATTLLRKRREKESVNLFLRTQEADPRCRNLNLASYLLKPIQRVTKYPLLLREKIKRSDEGDEEREALERALHKIQGVVQQLNEKQGMAENREKLEEIAARFADRKFARLLIPSPDFQDKDLRFVMEGKGTHLVHGKPEDSLHLFLFEGLLVSGKKIGYGKVKSQILKAFKTWKLDSLVINEGWRQDCQCLFFFFFSFSF